MNVLICVNAGKEKSLQMIRAVCTELLKSGITPLLESGAALYAEGEGVVCGTVSELEKKADFFLTIGGDGTILRWGKKAAALDKPLLGINTGRLGFMATLEKDEIDKLFRLKSGEFSISRRMLMDVEIRANGKIRTELALNDVVLYKSTHSKLPEFAVSVSGQEVSNIRADGLIFSTPTGSTAYSLSAGGPIIQPEMDCIEFTTLCAHTLFARPMIFSADSALSVSFLPYENSEVFLSVDGEAGIELFEGDEVIFKKSKHRLNLVDIDGDSFFSAVHNKLMKPLK